MNIILDCSQKYYGYKHFAFKRVDDNVTKKTESTS